MRLDISQPQYQKMESGKIQMKIELYFKILEILDIEVVFRERIMNKDTSNPN